MKKALFIRRRLTIARLLFLISTIYLLTSCLQSHAQAGEWTWMRGADTANFQGSWGPVGIPSATNDPPALYEMAFWNDNAGNFLLFGGVSKETLGPDRYYSAVWKFDPVTTQWAWLKGPNQSGQAGSYGVLGIPSFTNNPGARSLGMLYWKDLTGDFWLFGGLGYDGSGNFGALSDLWKYSPSSNQWTWMGGASTANQTPQWGTFQVFDAANIPPPLNETTASWVDTSGNLWLFGGYYSGYHNAVWTYDTDINQWAWMNGSNTANAGNSYGTKGVFDALNHPSGREAYCTWEQKGLLWLYAGEEFLHSYSDVWQFNPVTREWAWYGGSNVADYAGNAGSLCDTSTQFAPRSRTENTMRWIDKCGNVCMYGGLMSHIDPKRENDLWIYYPDENRWGWIDGSLQVNQSPAYGTIGVPSPANDPGGRFGSAAWSDPDGNFWLYGGWDNNQNILGDLWKYTPDSTCTGCIFQQVAFSASNNILCEKFCVDFFDQSTSNPTSWLWLFPGGLPSTSTNQDPANICYDVPGTYDVTLIITGVNGNDTLMLSNYITVYPTPPFPTISQTGYTLTSSPAATYQWQFNSVDIPGATNQSCTATQTGLYTVVVSDSNGCINSATLYVEITGIEDLLSDQNISIYPNPSSGNFIVEFSFANASANTLLNSSIAGEIKIEVMNTLGQIVFSSEEFRSIGTTSSWKKEIDLNDIGNGVYFIRIRSDDSFAVQKIVISN